MNADKIRPILHFSAMVLSDGQHHPDKKGRAPDKQGQKGTVFRFPIGCQHGLPRVGGW